MMTVDGFPVPIGVAGPEKSPAVVVLGAAQQAVAAYDSVCQRLHTASLRTIVIGADSRLTGKSVLGLLDTVGVRWAVIVGDRVGAELAWELAATRLDRFTALVVVDRGHPAVADQDGNDPRRAMPAGRDQHHRAGELTRRAGGGSRQPALRVRRLPDRRHAGRRNVGESTAQLAAEIVLRTSTW